jgi:Tfp pilus assembly protein PilO
MSFWVRIYRERRRILLPLALAFVANVGVFLLAVVPLQSSMDALESNEIVALAELAAAKRTRDRATSASKSRILADAQLKEFYGRVLPKDFATARKTTSLWLQQAAADAGLSFKSLRFAPDEVDDSRLSKASATMNLQGRYPDIRRFLHAIETAEEFIVIERVEVVQSDTTQLGRDSELAVDLTVATYFVTPASQ